MIKAILILLICAGIQHQASAYTLDEVKAIIGEAEAEPQEGKEAVACAINNRGTMKGIYGGHSFRVRHQLYSKTIFVQAVLAAEIAEVSPSYCDELIHGAQFWEGAAFPKPYWAKSMKLTAVIGHQRFYRKD